MGTEKILLMTGASSDIGLAYMKLLNEQKEHHVILGQYYSNGTLLEKAREKYLNLKIIPYCCNLENEDEVRKWTDCVRHEGIIPNQIVHLAAPRLEYIRYKNLTYKKIEDNMKVQVASLFWITQEFLPDMVKEHYGRIVIMLTACTLGVPPRNMSHYVISKYALLGLIKSLSSEYGDKGIRINGISPNMIESKFLQNIDPRFVEKNAMNSTMKRNVYVDEVAETIRFLLSEKAEYFNGINLNMTGGDIM